MTDTLHESIDAAGQALLKRCEATDAEGKSIASIGQHTEAFLALIKWAEAKSKILSNTPVTPPTESAPDKKFQGLKESFHGTAGKRARRLRSPRPDDETVSDGAAPEIAAAPPADAGIAGLNGAVHEPAAESGQPHDG